MLRIPNGALAADSTIDDDAAAAERKRIAEMLRNGESLNVSSTGRIHDPSDSSNSDGSSDDDMVDSEVELVIPSGKLA